MSTKTKLELAIHVLRDLGVIDASESPDETNDDVAWVIDQYEDKFQELAAPGLELTYWSRDTIPSAVFGILVDLISNDVAASFGQPQSIPDKMQVEEIILKKLRRHVARSASGLPTVTEYF